MRSIEEFIERAIDEGIEQGRHRVALVLARGVLTRRFGTLPAETLAVLEAASADTLEELALRALDAPSLAELGLPG